MPPSSCSLAPAPSMLFLISLYENSVYAGTSQMRSAEDLVQSKRQVQQALSISTIPRSWSDRRGTPDAGSPGKASDTVSCALVLVGALLIPKLIIYHSITFRLPSLTRILLLLACFFAV